MTRLTAAQLYQYNRAAGFSVAAAITMTAIDLAESGGNAAALGDTTLETSTWGPSVGAAQVRSLKAQTGTGSVRDILRLTDPAGNAAAAYAISSGGKDFTPWTTYTRSTYAQYLGTAAAAAGSAGTTAAPAGYTASPTGLLSGPAAAVRSLTFEALAAALGLGLLIMGAARSTGRG